MVPFREKNGLTGQIHFLPIDIFILSSKTFFRKKEFPS